MNNNRDAQDAAPLGDARTIETALDGAAQALFRLGRLFGKRPLLHTLESRTARAVELSRILVAEAVATGAEPSATGVTVGVVAARLAVDPSTASRLVAETIQDGYVARVASPADARRAQLALTEAGHALVADARRYQRAVFDEITQDWAAPERAEFARLLARFTDTLAERLAAPEPPPRR